MTVEVEESGVYQIAIFENIGILDSNATHVEYVKSTSITISTCTTTTSGACVRVRVCVCVCACACVCVRVWCKRKIVLKGWKCPSSVAAYKHRPHGLVIWYLIRFYEAAWAKVKLTMSCSLKS